MKNPPSFIQRTAAWIICGLSLAQAAVGYGAASQSQSAKADALVSQLRKLPNPIPSCEVIMTGGLGSPCPSAATRDQLYAQLRELGGIAVAALWRAYDSPDVRLRRNVAGALEDLGGGYRTYPGYGELHGMDISAALPGITKGLSDTDESVRAWSAQALSHVGPKGVTAVPKLIEMLDSGGEGDRNRSCIALRGIGKDAKAAIPALTHALDDPSKDVRHFAPMALSAIE